MRDTDIVRIIDTARELVDKLPSPQTPNTRGQGLLLGLVQSGKTIALTSAIAMAADNGYRCFIVLTSDNLWLFDQTVGRLKERLPRLQVVGKNEWDLEESLMPGSLTPVVGGLVLVATKNASVLTKLNSLLDRIATRASTACQRP
jgi:hypothetical protein